MEREELVNEYGEVMDTKEVQQKYEVISFLAPYVMVERKADNVRGTLVFQHEPRYYFNFKPE